jgi:hypothetical protein
MTINNSFPLQMLLSTLAVQLPVLLACLAGCVVVIVKWRDGSSGSLWALLGFSLGFLLCLVVPVVQTAVQRWVMENSEAMQTRAAVLSGLSFFWSFLRAATYALLLVAVFAGRSQPQTINA